MNWDIERDMKFNTKSAFWFCTGLFASNFVGSLNIIQTIILYWIIVVTLEIILPIMDNFMDAILDKIHNYFEQRTKKKVKKNAK
jgi:hypothetical protein